MNAKKAKRQRGSLSVLLAYEPPNSRRKVLARLTDSHLIAEAAQAAMLAAGDRLEDQIQREMALPAPDQVM